MFKINIKNLYNNIFRNSLKLKIFVLCIFVYISTLIATCVIVTEISYQNMISQELKRFLSDEKSMYSSIMFYFNINRTYITEDTVKSYASSVTESLSNDDLAVEIFNQNKTLLASTKNDFWKGFPADGLNFVLSGKKNYVLRYKSKNHYLSIYDLVTIGNQKLVLCFTKDITFADNFRSSQYYLFIYIGFIGLIIVTIVSIVLSKYVISPINNLAKTAKTIALGSFGERVSIKSNDEVGILASQFNIMTDVVEKTIQTLKEENEKKQRFIDNLTHELRTPLTTIIGYSDFLLRQENVNKNTYEKSLNYIKTEGKRIVKLVNNLMDLILVRNSVIQMEEFSVLKLFNEVKLMLYPKAHQKGINIYINGDDNILKANLEMIKQVILNLLDNAIKSSPEKSIIILGTYSKDGKIILYIEDHGKGISEDDKTKVFEPFFRVDKSRARKEGGIGLGLAICNEIIQAHDGEIQTDSQIGKGTIFSVIFKDS